MLNFCLLTRKGTSLRGTASFDVLRVKIGSGADRKPTTYCRLLEEPEKKEAE